MKSHVKVLSVYIFIRGFGWAYGIACARLSDSRDVAKITRARSGEGAVAGKIGERLPNRPLFPQPPRIFRITFYCRTALLSFILKQAI